MTNSQLMMINICGLSFVGSDVGGFVGDPTPDLLVRWYQIGCFHPFFRGHSAKSTKRREPWLFDATTKNLIADAIKLRYQLLPFYYTQFQKHSANGAPVMRPLWMNYPASKDYYKDDNSFMIGSTLLICGVTKEKQKFVSLGNLPGRWYQLTTFKETSTKNPIKAELSQIYGYLRGGKILPMFNPK